MRTLILAALCSAAFAQTVPQSGDFSHLPTYLVGVGEEVNPSGILATLAVRIGGSNLYSWTTMDTPVHQASPQIVASIRTGAAYVAAHSGNCFLFFLGDAGLATAPGSATLGAYSGGGGMFCTSAKHPQLYFGPVVRATKISASTVSPTAEVMLNWSF